MNDNTPIFQESFVNLTLAESLAVGTPVLNLVATDIDFGLNGLVNYTILSEESSATGLITDGTVYSLTLAGYLQLCTTNPGFTLEVDVSTGILRLSRALDRETIPIFTTVIAATDQGSGNNQALVCALETYKILNLVKILQATVVVNVTDTNDNRPIFSIPPGGYEVALSENVTVGTEVITVLATDIDQGPNQIITYSLLTNLSDVPIPFSIPDPTVSCLQH